MHLDDDASRNGVSIIIPGSQAELETLKCFVKGEFSSGIMMI